MSSLRRILSSRANGRLSKGPTSAAGKQRSSLNAVTHGILAKHLVLDSESADGFLNMLNTHLTRIQPADDLEASLVEDLVAALWRVQRTRAVETRMINDAADAGPEDDPLGRLAAAIATLNESGALPQIHRYESRLHTMYQRGLQNLLLLKAFVPTPLEEEPAPERPLELPPAGPVQ